ncbi:RcnB family protein [Acinetobacter sp. MD2(2019)]|uniref:RcnB family protein n=1 Tax=Acinetobacter sp. MD2(2019) TaxID=2605273 RepID=UPI002D1F7641|nr:RcnB family protein [Acinetobacter sp. MD2(2019)]MEB3754516.1 RcnB family protein [Acinetobacter sp. MD2(2019)]
MKRFLIPLMIGSIIECHFSVAVAGPPPQAGPNMGNRLESENKAHNLSNMNASDVSGSLFEDLQERRRQREELGFQRLKQMRWQKGYTMPQHYRGDSYKVDYVDVNLPKPGPNQQWYKINNDHLLIDLSNNSIVDIK